MKKILLAFLVSFWAMASPVHAQFSLVEQQKLKSIVAEWILNGDTFGVGGGGSGHVIEEEGGALTQRANINFVGTMFTCIDDNPDTKCTFGGTSANLAADISNETGTGVLVFNDTPTLLTPTIASFANATHNHSNAAGGGTLASTNLSDTAVIVLENQTNVYGAFLQDFGAATLELPNSAGAAPTTDALIAYDTTADKLKYGNSGSTKTVFAVGDNATDVAFTPSGNIAATNVGTAIVELDSEKQPIDPDLTEITGITCIGGFYRIGANDYECRTLTGHTNVLTITNGDGVSGAPAFAVANSLIDGSSRFAADAGSTDDYAACPLSISTMSTPAYVDGSIHSFRANTANTGASTLNLCSLGSRAIVKVAGGVSSALNTNDIRVGQNVIVQYRSSTSEFQIQSTLGNVSTTAAAGSDTQCQFNDGGTALGGDAGCTYDKTTDILSVTGGVVAGTCGADCVTVTTAAGTGARAYRFTTAADTDLVGTVASATRTAGNLSRWNSSGQLVNAGTGRKAVEVEVFPPGTNNSTGDGKVYWRVPTTLDGMNLVAVAANVITAGTTGTLNVDIARCAAAATGNVCSGTVSDMLSTNLTIDTGENSSSNAAAAAVIDAANDDVATGQIIRIDVDAVHTTPAQGLVLVMEFELP